MLIKGTAVTIGIAALGVLLAIQLSIEVSLTTSAILALVVGCSMSLFSTVSNSAVAGLIASILTLIALGIGQSLVVPNGRDDAMTKSFSEESFIQAIAETMMWQLAMNEDHVEGSEGSELAVPGADLLAPAPKIPVSLLQQAAEQWTAMPEAEKKELRQTRKRLLTGSHGKTQVQYGKWLDWSNLIGIGSLGVSLAFLTGASAAIRGGH